MKIYVASSWRNEHQPAVVKALRAAGHEVYDFREPRGPGSSGFSWREIDPNWQRWSPDDYIWALNTPIAKDGFESDMNALIECDACVFVMPCGVSASMEFGYACGAGKITLAYIPGLREPDLMVLMADFITTSLTQGIAWLESTGRHGRELNPRRTA